MGLWFVCVFMFKNVCVCVFLCLDVCAYLTVVSRPVLGMLQRTLASWATKKLTVNDRNDSINVQPFLYVEYIQFRVQID